MSLHACVYYYRTMAEDNPEDWGVTRKGFKCLEASSPRDVLIIVSSESLEGPDIVPRRKGELTKEDMDRLTSQGIPQESWHDDARLMEARNQRNSKKVKNVYIENDPASTREHILKRIATLFKNTTQSGGMT